MLLYYNELLPIKKFTVQTDDVYGKILNCSEGNGKLRLAVRKKAETAFQKLRSLPLEKAIYICFCPISDLCGCEEVQPVVLGG